MQKSDEALINELSEELQIDKSVLEREVDILRPFTTIYDELRQLIISKYRNKTGGELIKIGDITFHEHTVSCIVRVMSSHRFQRIRDMDITEYAGILMDETGWIYFSSSRPIPDEPGHELFVANARIIRKKGMLRMLITPETEVSESKSDILSSVDMIQKHRESFVHSLAQFTDGDSNLVIEGFLSNINNRNIESENGIHEIYSGLLKGEDLTLPITFWSNQIPKNNSYIRIYDAYVTSVRGMPHINAGYHSWFEEIPVKNRFESGRSMISSFRELEDIEGCCNHEFEADVLNVKKGSGIVRRCSACRKIVNEDRCDLHPDAETFNDLRIKCIFDDGSGAVEGFMDRAVSESFLGRDMESMIGEIINDIAGEEDIRREIARDIEGKHFRIICDVISGSAGTHLIINSIEPFSPDIDKNSEKILEIEKW